MRKWTGRIGLALAVLLATAITHGAETLVRFKTPLAKAMLDPAVFAAWVDGKQLTEGLPAQGPSSALWKRIRR